ncbi:MAG: hypothetical protein WD042_06095 [Phycisphaeraceae bacterium]
MPQAKPTAKEMALQVIRDQPADSSVDELLREILFLRMIERGTADSDAGRTISHQEMKRRVDTWRKSGGRKKRKAG